MFIAIRKETNGSLYMDKNVYSRTQEVRDKQGNITIQPLFSDEQLSRPPYNYTKVEIDNKYSDCVNQDFNEDLTFNIEKYNARKQNENENEYENKIVSLIRQRYNINQELAILRQRDSKPLEFQEYFDYVEQCKVEVKNEYY
jgi:hypothetical protein